jgi:hypothetical protein
MDAKNSGLVKTRQAMYGDVTLRCCSGKAISITYYILKYPLFFSDSHGT